MTYRAGVLSHPVRESRGTLYTIALIGLTPAPFSPGSLSEGPKMSVGINVFKNYLVVFFPMSPAAAGRDWKASGHIKEQR